MMPVSDIIGEPQTVAIGAQKTRLFSVGAVGDAWLRRLDGEIAWSPCYHVPMIESFYDRAAQDVFNGVNSKAARKSCPQKLWKIATRKLDQLDSVQSLEELRLPPGNRLEALSGDRQGQHSIRINEQYRICFVLGDLGPSEVEVTDDHQA